LVSTPPTRSDENPWNMGKKRRKEKKTREKKGFVGKMATRQREERRFLLTERHLSFKGYDFRLRKSGEFKRVI